MKILSVGASGYLGSAIADRLRSAGHAVTATARTEESVQALQARGLTPVRATLTDATVLAAAAAEADGVVFTAWTGMGGDGTGATELAALEALLAGAARSGAGATGVPFLLGSSTAVYGDTGPQPVREDTPLKPFDADGWRVRAEDLVLGARPPVRGAALRPPFIYGRGGNLLVKGNLAAVRTAPPLRVVGEGANRWSYVHVDDLADLYLLLLTALADPDHGAALAGRAWNAATGDIGLRELNEAIAAAGGHPGAVVPWPVEEARAVLPEGYLTFQTIDQVVDASAARALGWKPRRPAPAAFLADPDELAAFD